MKTDLANTAAGSHIPRRYLFIAILCILSLVSCGGLLAYAGVPLALAEAETKAGEDRLAGIFVTTDYIEPGMPHVDVNARGEIVIKEQAPDKIYGTVNDRTDRNQPPVSFPGLEGFGIYCLQFWEDASQAFSYYWTADNIFAGLNFSALDEEDLVEASFYVKSGTPCAYYFHPVYQQEDGQAYLLPGSGISSDSFDGFRYSYSLSQSVSRNWNGTEETKGYRYSVTVIGADAPGDTELLFISRDGKMLRSLSGEELEARFQSDMPQLEIPADVAYLILRQTKNGSSEYTHTLFDRGAECLEYMVAAEDRFLHPRNLSLTWMQ